MINVVIIDDEERARKSLQALLNSYCPDVNVIAQCENVPEGVLAINKHKPELVFLDIEMPEYNGFELLDFFREVDFEIVFVTAYSEYAVKAFEVSAVDYLLKPVDIEALQASVEKFRKKRTVVAMQQKLDLLKDVFKNGEVSKIALPMNDGLLFIEISEIILLDADGAYTNVILKNGSRILVSKKLKFFEDILINRPAFFRTHRSHLININFLRKYTRGESTIQLDNNITVSLSRDRKQEFEALLKELRFSV